MFRPKGDYVLSHLQLIVYPAATKRQWCHSVRLATRITKKENSQINLITQQQTSSVRCGMSLFIKGAVALWLSSRWLCQLRGLSSLWNEINLLVNKITASCQTKLKQTSPKHHFKRYKQQTFRLTCFQKTFSIRSNLLQDCPSVLRFAVAVLFIPSFDFFSGSSLCFTQFGGSSYCWDFQKNFVSYPTFKHAHSREQLLRPHSHQIYARSQKRELWAQDLKTASIYWALQGRRGLRCLGPPHRSRRCVRL